jgi:hypothetical protein
MDAARTECVCKLGYKMTVGICDNCPIGDYKPIVGNGGCTTCPERMTTRFTSSTDLSDCVCKASFIEFNNTVTQTRDCTCNVGYEFVDMFNEKFCSICRADAFMDHIDMAPCTACGATRQTMRMGATNATECVCRSGYYLQPIYWSLPAQALHSCTKCPVGAKCYGDMAQPAAANGYLNLRPTMSCF